MLKIFPCLFAAFFLLSNITFSQNQYEIIKDSNGQPILKGLISPDKISGDSSFKWYKPNQKNYSADNSFVKKFIPYKDSVHLLVFMGTWCEDSHYLLPKLFSFLDAAGYAKDHLTLVGVDRQKKTLNNLSEAFNVTLVPTVIVLKDGKEIGRVVEYGKSGFLENDVAEIVSAPATASPSK